MARIFLSGPEIWCFISGFRTEAHSIFFQKTCLQRFVYIFGVWSLQDLLAFNLQIFNGLRFLFWWFLLYKVKER